ncbi:MAG: hypothetical protein J6V72_20780 [Kiritimatiellae bacterium]|nr:hypothetical protein [Kiritimatiellia bacterium]
MIKITSNISETTVRLGAWISNVKGAGRRLLYSAAANAVSIVVRGHLAGLAGWKHTSASRLDAQPTGFLGKAARGTVHIATENYGEVVIPAPLGRAFHDVEIRPRNAAALTIPASAEAYGKRAGVLAALGWNIFRPKKKDFLMGSINGEDPKILYWLKGAVRQKQDRSLLPSDAEMQRAAAAAIAAEIMRVRSMAS